MSAENISLITRPRKIVVALPPALLIITTILLFGSFNIFEGNVEEFSFTLTPILSFYAIPSLIGLSVLSGQSSPVSSSDLAGSWDGVIHFPGVALRMRFELTQEPGGGLRATLDSLDQAGRPQVVLKRQPAAQAGDRQRVPTHRSNRVEHPQVVDRDPARVA